MNAQNQDSLQDPIVVFRIDNTDPSRGLWYNVGGTYTGEVIDDMTYCRASHLPMPYDETLAGGWRSATRTAQELLNWFNLEELGEMQKEGFLVSMYTTTQYQVYTHHDQNTNAKIPHMIFKDTASELIDTLNVNEFRQMLES